MPVDETMAYYGDVAHVTAVAIYLLAMILHAVEYASGRAADRTARLVGVGGGADQLDADPDTGSAAGRSRPERFGRSAVALTVLAALVHAGSLTMRGLAAGRVPWSNMYEFASAVCLVAVVGWLVVLRRQGVAVPQLRRLGLFVLLPVVVLMFLAGTVLHVQAAPLIPALRSYWITVHVSAASVASGILLIAGVASVLYLLRVRAQSTGSPDRGVVGRLPDAATLDRLAYRATVLAVPIWTFAIITGAIWAEAAWGRYWGWDPKETCSLIAWVVYAGYLHARATAGWRGSRAAWINVFGFAVMLFNLFFVNIVIAGFHSYAGL